MLTILSPCSPHLYDLRINLSTGDSVLSYFGMRTWAKATDGGGYRRATLNGKWTLAAGVLDQGYWPGGRYTAPTDSALAADLHHVLAFAYNTIRVHQKVHPER